MIPVLGNLPRKLILACSGGSDSMAVLDFLLRRERKIIVAYFDHGTPMSPIFLSNVSSFCKNREIELVVGTLTESKEKKTSQEEFWRNQRYSFLKQLSLEKECDVITCHHLDDQVETWIATSCHGKPRLIPYRREMFIRPFLLTRKKQLKVWCEDNDVPFVEDPSNQDVKIPRNRIRHNLLPEILQVNPGIHKVIRKKTLAEYDEKCASFNSAG